MKHRNFTSVRAGPVAGMTNGTDIQSEGVAADSCRAIDIAI